MAFIKYQPSAQPFQSLSTSNNLPDQLWQELTAIRFLNRPRGIKAKTQIAPWIDQAKMYFADALSSHWKSAGLLFYYSFLNLAKAFLVAKTRATVQSLKAISLYHGLSANPQSPARIIDFQIQIHPPLAGNGQQNVFSLFYEGLLNVPWPFRHTISITLADILGYCDEITSEIQNFYSISQSMLPTQSLIREVPGQLWFELVVPSALTGIILPQINMPLTIVPSNQMTDVDRNDWLIAFDRTSQSLADVSFLRTAISAHNSSNRPQVVSQLIQQLPAAFSQCYQPHHSSSMAGSFWLIVPKIRLNSIDLPWSPVLSDYLIAFVLSTILRYYPHLFPTNHRDSFFAEAWCNQSAITALRRYIMRLTTPSIRIN